MGKYSDELIHGITQSPKKTAMEPATQRPPLQIVGSNAPQEAPQGRSYSEQIMFPKEPPRDQPVEDGPAPNIGALVASKVADDPRTQIRYFAKSRFPNEPDAEERYGIMGGDVVYLADDGKIYRELAKLGPGHVLDKVAEGAASVAANSPSLVLGGLGAVAGLPGGIPGVMAGSAVGAAGGEGIRKAVANLAMDEPQTAEANMKSMALEGGLSAAGTFLGARLGRWLDRGRAKDIARLDRSEAERLRTLAAEKGIVLTPAELTNLQSLKAQQTLLNNAPASADTMGAFYDARKQEVENAVKGELDKIAPEQDSHIVAEQSRQAIQDAEKSIKKQRSDAAAPLYQNAYASGPVDIGHVVAKADELAKNFPEASGIAATIRKAKNLLLKKDADGNAAPLDSLRVLDGAKQELDDMIGKALDARESKKAKFLQDIRDELLGALDNASSDYALARKTWAVGSEPLDQIDSGLARIIRDLPDEKLQNAAAMMFNPKTSGAVSIRRAKQLIQDQNPEAWDGLVRSFLQNTWEDAAARAMKAGTSSDGWRFRDMVFLFPRQREMLKEAMTPQQYKSLSDLMDVLDATRRVKTVGSDTAYKTEMLRELSQKYGGLARYAVYPLQIGKGIFERISQIQMGKHADRLANIITSPDGMAKLKELKNLNPNSEKFLLGLGNLLGVEASAALPEADPVP